MLVSYKTALNHICYLANHPDPRTADRRPEGDDDQASPLCGRRRGELILLTAAAAQDAALLKQAQEIFQPLPKDIASLRNVAMTPPYFHDGSVATLPDAVKVMARVQLGVDLSDDDARDIKAFLEALTGKLPPSFATAPVLPSGAIAPPK